MWSNKCYFYLIIIFCWQIDPLEKEAMVVKDMYELIEQYTVPTPPEDFAVYQVISAIYRKLIENIPFSTQCDLNGKFAYPCDINPRGVI